MNIRWVLLLVSVSSMVLPTSARGQSYADRGAVLGGVAGALAGAGIGNHNDETAEGALIGGAVGLLTGAAVGHSMDNRAVDARAAQRYAQQVRQQQLARAVSAQDVVTMTQNGLSDEVIINHIRQHGVQRSLDVHDVISLHRQGVREAVISAMQRATVGPAPPPATPVVRQPVVVEELHYVAPAPYWYPPPHYYRHHVSPRYHRPGVSWGITVHN